LALWAGEPLAGGLNDEELLAYVETLWLPETTRSVDERRVLIGARVSCIPASGTTIDTECTVPGNPRGEGAGQREDE
jgi:hypothetical protein